MCFSPPDAAYRLVAGEGDMEEEASGCVYQVSRPELEAVQDGVAGI
jgi:hypothetical protein